MKKLEAIIKPFKVEEVKSALAEVGIEAGQKRNERYLCKQLIRVSIANGADRSHSCGYREL
jgi:hypothetical protein